MQTKRTKLHNESVPNAEKLSLKNFIRIKYKVKNVAHFP